MSLSLRCERKIESKIKELGFVRMKVTGVVAKKPDGFFFFTANTQAG